MSDPVWRWLVWEGVVPVLGSTIFYSFFGICTFLNFGSAGSTKAPFQWSGALDPLSWLYGAAVLGIQSGVRGWEDAEFGYVGGAILVSVLSLGILGVSMIDRASGVAWKATRGMHLMSFFFVVGALVLGFVIHGTVLKKAAESKPAEMTTGLKNMEAKHD